MFWTSSQVIGRVPEPCAASSDGNEASDATSNDAARRNGLEQAFMAGGSRGKGAKGEDAGVSRLARGRKGPEDRGTGRPKDGRTGGPEDRRTVRSSVLLRYVPRN